MKIPKKSLGQNFLIDQNIIKKIVKLVYIRNKNIIEIGPGKGSLTNEILKFKPKSIKVIEKDNELAKKLEIDFPNKIQILNEDVLKINLNKLINNKSIIFGNLPYNISSQILVKFIKTETSYSQISDMIFMFQKEVAEKINGTFPSKDYGRLSILSNLKYKVVNKFLISPNCFFPKPKVESMVLHLKPKKNKYQKMIKIENLEKITNLFFSNRRKMIRKKVLKFLNPNSLVKIKGLTLDSRPSDLKPETYYQITSLFEENL